MPRRALVPIADAAYRQIGSVDLESSTSRINP